MIKFGTSGFRAVLAEDYTKENVQKIAMALCKIIKEDKIKKPKIVVGFDNRFMGYKFGIWTCEVLGKYADILFHTKPTTTPIISFETKDADFGIMLTASHNPYFYNGVKVFLRGGRDCDDEFAKRVEKIANQKSLIVEKDSYENLIKKKKIVENNDFLPYCKSALSFVDLKKIKKSGIRVLANCMHGSSIETVRYLLDALKIDYEIMNDTIDPYFEGKLPAPYKNYLEEQAKRVVKEKFDIGVAFDGDGDRFSIVSSSGKYYDCNFVGAVIYYYLKKYKNYGGGITKNYAITSLYFKIAKMFGEKVYETKVGFKNVAKSLLTTDSFMGVESNGVAFQPHSLIKDGPLTALLLIDALCTIGKSFDDILKEIQTSLDYKSQIVEYNYTLSDEQKKYINNLVFKNKSLPEIKGYKVVDIDFEDGCKVIYENDYFVLIRFSGTEPVIRVYAEMKDMAECDKIAGIYEKFLKLKSRQQ